MSNSLPIEQHDGTILGRPAQVVIRRSTGWTGLDFQGLWEYRELLFFLIWRDMKVRYKQTVLGASWAVVQPVATVIIFSVVFGGFARLPSDGVPYHLNTYCALLPWGLFAGAVNRSGSSLVSSSNLISKVYFPRIVIPLAAVLGALVDYAISLGLFFVLMVFHRVTPSLALLTLPIWTLLILSLGLAVGLALSALNVRYRDVTYLLTFGLQIWMFASPIAYSVSIVPQKWRAIFELNPLVGMIQGFRWSLLGNPGGSGVAWLPAVLVTGFMLVGAIVYFRRVERYFADII